MTSAEAYPQSTVVVHPTALLEQPKFGSRAITLLWGGDRVATGPYTEGFLMARHAGREGFLPAAACEPLAVAPSHGDQPIVQVNQPAWLYRRVPPGGYIASPWIVAREETLVVIGRAPRFVQIRRSDGQVGYIPELLCEPFVRAADGTEITRARQPIALYSYPEPGGQFSSDRIIAPKEQLLVLGADHAFRLVQRDDGRVGYVAAALCGPATPDALLKVGPLDLGWMAIGMIWALPNLIALLLALRETRLLDTAMRPYAGIGVALVVAAALWFAGRRRYMARSFALGVLLAYALIHNDSAGSLTFWV